MPFKNAVSEVLRHNATLAFGLVGGGVGLVVLVTQSGWLPIPLGIAIGLYVALWVVYAGVRNQRDAFQRKLEELEQANQHLPFIVTVPETSKSAAYLEARLLVLNRQPQASLSLALALRIDEPSEDGTVKECWVSQADQLGSFSLAVPAQGLSDGVVGFRHHHAGAIHLVVIDMVSGRRTPPFPIPGTFPPSRPTLQATTVTTFTKAPNETVEFSMIVDTRK